MQLKWLSVGTALLLGGCASVEMVNYTVTSFPEVPLNAKAKVKIVTQDDGLQPVVQALKSEMAKSGAYSVVDDEADYWFVLGGGAQYSKQHPIKKFAKVKQESGNGGTEVVAPTTLNLASAAKGVSVAVYEAKSLTPIHYMDVPIYAGDATSGAVRSGEAYDADFSKQAVERVMDAFVTQKKQVETPIPVDADKSLREFFAKGDYKAFAAQYKKLGAIDLKKYYDALRSVEQGTADEATKALVKDADQRYANYYLYLLVKESLVTDPKVLKEMQAQHLMMLETSTAKGLVEAVPVALARLEYKIANLSK